MTVPHNPADEVEMKSDDDYWPFIPPAEYQMVYAREDKQKMFGRTVWIVQMRVIEGEHTGVALPWYLNAIPKGKRPTPGFHLCSAFAIATERRPPKDLWRRRPSSFLKGCAFLARVRSITRDSHHVERPAAAHVSRVDCLLERTVGCSEYLLAGKQ
jgi:hypothetical protein